MYLEINTSYKVGMESEQFKQQYNKYVEDVTPKVNLFKNVRNAFIVGGLICVMGQVWIELFTYWGFDKETASGYTTLALIAESVLLTGLNIYPKITKYGGAGSLVPITGFANSVAAPAIEFKKEGQVFGIGCKIFNIAGPVILYGILTSWVLGLGYWILKIIGVF